MRKRQLKRDTGGIGGVARTLIDRHSGRGTIFGVFELQFDSYGRYLDFQTKVLHGIPSQTYLAEWFDLGSNFGRNASCSFIPKTTMLIVWEPFPKTVSSLNVPGSL